MRWRRLWLGQLECLKLTQGRQLRGGQNSCRIGHGSRLGRLADAIAHYQTALSLKPDYPEAHTNLGNAFLRSGRPAEAVAEYRTALQLTPGYAPARENLSYALRLVPGAAAASPRTDPPAPR